MTAAGGQPSPSPPTDRVVGIVELLVAGDRPMTVTEIGRRLGLNRATTAAILASLETAGWIERVPGRRYRPGAGLVPLAAGARARLPFLSAAARVVRGVAGALHSPTTLSQVQPTRSTMLLSVEPDGQPAAEVGTPLWFPIRPPLGVAIVAFRPAAERAAWLRQMPDQDQRAHLRAMLETVRASRVAVWRLGQQNRDTPHMLQALSHLTAASAAGGPGLDRLLGPLLVTVGLDLAPSGYTADELAVATPRSVSYLTGVVLHDGEPRYELTVNLQRRDVPKRTLDRTVRRVREAVDELSELLRLEATA